MIEGDASINKEKKQEKNFSHGFTRIENGLWLYGCIVPQGAGWLKGSLGDLGRPGNAVAPGRGPRTSRKRPLFSPPDYHRENCRCKTEYPAESLKLQAHGR